MKIQTSKQLFLLSLFSLCTVLAFGQQALTDTTIYNIEILTTKPIYEGGETAMYRSLGQNIRFPMSGRGKEGTVGTAFISFVIDEKGQIDTTSTKLLYFMTGTTKKEPNPKRIFQESKLDVVQTDCTKEAKRVVKLLTHWSAGQIEGKAVKCRQALPITFKNEGFIYKR